MLRSILRFVRWLVIVGSFGAAIVAAALLRDTWMPFFEPRPSLPSERPAGPADQEAVAARPEQDVLELSPQARKNLGIVSRPAVLSDYRRTILVPGEITDRPGVSDRGVTSPVVGSVTQVHAFPGDTVRPLWISVTSLWGIRVPLAWVLAVGLGWGYIGCWATMAITQVFQGGLAMYWWQRGAWRRAKV